MCKRIGGGRIYDAVSLVRGFGIGASQSAGTGPLRRNDGMYATVGRAFQIGLVIRALWRLMLVNGRCIICMREAANEAVRPLGLWDSRWRAIAKHRRWVPSESSGGQRTPQQTTNFP